MPIVNVGGKKIKFPDDMSLDQINSQISTDKKRAERLAKAVSRLADKPDPFEPIRNQIKALQEDIKEKDVITPVESSVKDIERALDKMESRLIESRSGDLTEVLVEVKTEVLDAIKNIKFPRQRAPKRFTGIDILRVDDDDPTSPIIGGDFR